MKTETTSCHYTSSNLRCLLTLLPALFLVELALVLPCVGAPFQFENTGNLTVGRYEHTATLLPSGKVLIAGGSIPFGYAATAELYDPATGTWTITGSLHIGRAFHTATLLPNGKVLV